MARFPYLVNHCNSKFNQSVEKISQRRLRLFDVFNITLRRLIRSRIREELGPENQNTNCSKKNILGNNNSLKTFQSNNDTYNTTALLYQDRVDNIRKFKNFLPDIRLGKLVYFWQDFLNLYSALEEAVPIGQLFLDGQTLRHFGLDVIPQDLVAILIFLLTKIIN